MLQIVLDVCPAQGDEKCIWNFVVEIPWKSVLRETISPCGRRVKGTSLRRHIAFCGEVCCFRRCMLRDMTLTGNLLSWFVSDLLNRFRICIQ
jgi:hypothetical protein